MKKLHVFATANAYEYLSNIYNKGLSMLDGLWGYANLDDLYNNPFLYEGDYQLLGEIQFCGDEDVLLIYLDEDAISSNRHEFYYIGTLNSKDSWDGEPVLERYIRDDIMYYISPDGEELYR